ncbi:hypothetical protein, partial [Pseudomonas aeruginosa]|uniref:hypothetical protein n=1 Tax=Pseudomonas aeruginosa TaxID=287 RepID=UPI0031B7A320
QIMQLQKLVNMFGGDLTRRYGQKVHKLTMHGGFSCPNRDGTIGVAAAHSVMLPRLPMKRSSIVPLPSNWRTRRI